MRDYSHTNVLCRYRNFQVRCQCSNGRQLSLNCMRLRVEHSAGTLNFILERYAVCQLPSLLTSGGELCGSICPLTMFRTESRKLCVCQSVQYGATFLYSIVWVIFNPKKGRNGPRMLMGDFEQLTLLRLLLENPGIYLQELQDELLDIFGVLIRQCTYYL